MGDRKPSASPVRFYDIFLDLLVSGAYSLLIGWCWLVAFERGRDGNSCQFVTLD